MKVDDNEVSDIKYQVLMYFPMSILNSVMQNNNLPICPFFNVAHSRFTSSSSHSINIIAHDRVITLYIPKLISKGNFKAKWFLLQFTSYNWCTMCTTVTSHLYWYVQLLLYCIMEYQPIKMFVVSSFSHHSRCDGALCINLGMT